MGGCTRKQVRAGVSVFVRRGVGNRVGNGTRVMQEMLEEMFSLSPFMSRQDECRRMRRLGDRHRH